MKTYVIVLLVSIALLIASAFELQHSNCFITTILLAITFAEGLFGTFWATYELLYD